MERTPETNSWPEKRRQTRFAVTQSARLTIGDQRDIPCEIQDFCLGGLFLRFNSSEMTNLTAGKEGYELKVAFTPPASLGSHTVEINGKLARRASNGIGVAFIGNPRDATRLLHKIATAGRAQRIIANLHPERGNEGIREAAQALLADTAEVSLQRFAEIIEERLNAASSAAKSFNDHNELLQAVNEFKVHMQTIREQFHKEVLDSVRKSETGQFELEDDTGESGGLSIVEKEEFEDWLNATSEAHKLEERFQTELYDLEPRLEHIYGHALDASVNPYGPTRVFRAFANVIEPIIKSGKVRQVAYITLKEVVQEPLSGLYQRLDEILPKVERALSESSSQGRQGGASGSRDSAADDQHPREEATGHPGDGGPQSSGAVGEESSGMSLGRMAQNLMSMFRRSPVPSTVPQTGATAGTAASAQAAPGGQPAAFPSSGPAFGAPGGGQGIVIGAPLPYAGRVIQELKAAGTLSPAREAQAQNSVDVFSTLVSAMGAEKSVAAEVRPFIQRIEEPLLKLAIQDPQFLDAPNHPAHRALNAIDRLSLVSSDDGKVKDENLLKLINRWTERIRVEAASNPGIYDEARSQLEKVLEPLMRARLGRIARLQEALEGWQKTSQAKRATTAKIEERLVGKPVPVVALDLLNTGWRNYLTRVRLRDTHGEEDERSAWEAFDQVLAWLDKNASEVDRLEAHHLLQYLDSHLSLVSADRDEQDRLVDRLSQHLLYTDDRSEIAYTTINPSGGDESEGEMSEEERNSLEGLRVGDWFLTEQMPEPLNLVWIGDDPPMYVFANFRGVKKFDAKPIDLAKRIVSGEMKRTDSLELPLMDRSFISMVQHMHRSLMRQAVLDPATGLIKQKEFMRRVRHAWLQAGSGDFGFAIGVMDFDDLRLYQSQVDDEGMNTLLNQLATFLKSRVQSADIFARCGERIFAYMVKAENHQKAIDDAERLIAEVSKFNFAWKGQRFPLTANIGLAWSVDCLDPNGLYTKADEACITSKHDGRNQIHVYREDDLAHQQEGGLVYWASNINKVLSENRLTLRCQPILPIQNVEGAPAHYEILIGIPEGASETINVGEFVASVERLKRGNELDRWVFSTVFDWIRENSVVFDKIGSFSINVSGQSIGSKGFFDFVNAELAKGDIPGHKLIFEITESAAIDSFAHAEAFVRHLRRYGCRFSLDDFGIGFSSYSYLKKLKVDYLKIDGSFVRDMMRNEVDVALVSSMNETSRLLGIKTIAESVENEETLDKLREIGVDFVQGYHTGRPVYIESLLAA